jgi:hypothetical protein
MLGVRAREAEVGDADAPILSQQKISGLEIAVNDALRVRMFEGKARLNGPGDGLICGNLGRPSWWRCLGYRWLRDPIQVD